MSIKLTLPYPPSANHAHHNLPNGSRILNKAARQFYDDVQMLVNIAGVEGIKGEYSLTIHVYRPRTNADLSNALKLTEDALQRAGAIENDKHCVRIVAERHEAEKPKKANARVIVELEKVA